MDLSFLWVTTNVYLLLDGHKSDGAMLSTEDALTEVAGFWRCQWMLSRAAILQIFISENWRREGGDQPSQFKVYRFLLKQIYINAKISFPFTD